MKNLRIFQLITKWYHEKAYAKYVVRFSIICAVAWVFFGLTAAGSFKGETHNVPPSEYLRLGKSMTAEELEQKLRTDSSDIQEIIFFKDTNIVVVSGKEFEEEKLVAPVDIQEIRAAAEAGKVSVKEMSSLSVRGESSAPVRLFWWLLLIGVIVWLLIFLFKERDEFAGCIVKQITQEISKRQTEFLIKRGIRKSQFQRNLWLGLVVLFIVLFVFRGLFNETVMEIPDEYTAYRPTVWQMERHLERAPGSFQRAVVIDEKNAVYLLVTKDAAEKKETTSAARLIQFAEDSQGKASLNAFVSRLTAAKVPVRHVDAKPNHNAFTTRKLMWTMLMVVLFFTLIFWGLKIIGSWNSWLEAEGVKKYKGAVAIGRGGARSSIGDLVNIAEEDKKTLDDVAGCDEAIAKFRLVAGWIKDSAVYAHFMAKLPKGILLTGPPGTGKTLLARGLAGEVDGTYFYASASEFVNTYVGVGASNVRRLFGKAKQAFRRTGKPSIIFIDELDAVGRQRRDDGGGGEGEQNQTINQLLTCIQGFDPNNGTLVIAATNRPESLDSGLTRSGRFDYKVEVGRPDRKGRKAIFNVYLKKHQLEPGVTLEEICDELSRRSHDFVGADIELAVNIAATVAATRNAPAFAGKSAAEVASMPRIIERADLHSGIDKVAFGDPLTSKVRAGEERRTTAIHEVGHGCVPTELGGDPVTRITIEMTTKSLGLMESMPEEDRYGWSKEQFLIRIKMMLAGRAAEELIGNSCSTGASNDFERASQLARCMTAIYGMTEELGVISFPVDKYGFPVSNIGADLQSDFNRTWRKIICDCDKETRELIERNRFRILRAAELLLEEETLTGAQFRENWALPQPHGD